MMQWKSRTGAALFFTALSLTCGCSSPLPLEPEVERVVIRVACPADAPAAVMLLWSKGWQGRNNADLEVVPYAADGPEATHADAWIIAPADLGRWANAGRLAPVPDELLEPDSPFAWNGLLPLYRENLLRWNRTAYALPLIGEAPLCVYRTDRFTEAGLKPPATWKDVEDAAAKLAKADGAPSLPPLPDDDGLEREFFSIAAGYAHKAIPAPTVRDFAFHYDYDAPATPRIAGPGFVRALALMQRLQAFRAKTGDSPVASFRKGVGAFCLTDAAEVFRLQQEGSAVRDRFAVARVPAAEAYFSARAKSGDEPVKGDNWVPYLGAGGWLGVVPKSSAHPTDAFNLLAELGGPDLSRQIALSPRAPVPRRRRFPRRPFRPQRPLGRFRPRRATHDCAQGGGAG